MTNTEPNRHLLALRPFVDVLILPFLLLCTLLIPKSRRELIWTPTPLINNKYWSNALRQAGLPSKTLMTNFQPTINKREDFDLYFDDVIPSWVQPRLLRQAIKPYAAFLHIVRHASVIHIPHSGGPLGQTLFWRLEAPLLRLAGIRIIVIPFGADIFRYSRVRDTALRHVLLLSFPSLARQEGKIAAHVDYWSRWADIIVPGLLIDGIGRWDIAPHNALSIDINEWRQKENYSLHDGYNGPVSIIHAPNHRSFKGTEFLIQAVDELKLEGLNIDLILVEKMPNQRVRELMLEADILVEQIIYSGYALTAIEGMATGLPVFSNLESDLLRVARLYTFMDECPIVSTTPETIKCHLRVLITNPDLRRQLGEAGRFYAEKYHSYKTTQYLFGAIYDQLLHGGDQDLLNLFHPLKCEYNRRLPLVEHPLTQGHLPSKYFSERVPETLSHLG